MKESVFTPKQIGERIKERRNDLGWTMETLGKALGVNKSTIQRYESKGIDPKKNYILVSVADALDTTVEWLTGSSDECELDISTRMQKTIDKRISAFIKTVTESVPHEQHQELMADILGCFVDMFGVFGAHFGKAATEVEKAENDTGLRESLMKYALDSGDIAEKLYRQEMDKPVEELKQMTDCLLRLYDKKGSALTEMFEIRNNAQKELKK